MAGIISYQRSGEPGQDNAQFFVRGITSFGAESKKDPLILIDNVEMSSTDLARLQPDDIASFSIMKDATATALYGLVVRMELSWSRRKKVRKVRRD